ncbi:MAG: glycosyltransferase family 10 [Bacteroidota bacterium]
MNKVKFVNFWNNNQGYLRFPYWFNEWGVKVEEVDDPDYLFYSVFGLDHLHYQCKKIFFTWENYPHYRHIDFDGYDFSISHYQIDDERHYWMPSWGWKLMTMPALKEALLKDVSLLSANDMLNKKNKKCCFVVSNKGCLERNAFFEKLSKRMVVESAGGYANNVGYNAPRKLYDYLDWMKKYKFIIAFENSSTPGYSTEKILFPLCANVIPIYWGDALLDSTLNPDCYINCHRFNTLEDAMEEVLRLDRDDEAYQAMLAAPKFIDNTLPKEFDSQVFADWLKDIVFT